MNQNFYIIYILINNYWIKETPQLVDTDKIYKLFYVKK